MDINKSCRLVLKDVHLYDISSCHYRILEGLGFDTSHIVKDDKLKRNTQIGLMMRDNPRLSKTLRDITNSTIDEYLTRNNIKENELILRSYDGFISTKSLQFTDLYLPIEKRDYFERMIISSNRQSYIAKSFKSKYTIKGIQHRYDGMDLALSSLLEINLSNRVQIFRRLGQIKNRFLSINDPRLFCIPIGEGRFNVFLKSYGEAEVSESLIKILDTSDVDKLKYFDFYLRPFFESIIMENL